MRLEERKGLSLGATWVSVHLGPGHGVPRRGPWRLPAQCSGESRVSSTGGGEAGSEGCAWSGGCRPLGELPWRGRVGAVS